MSTKKTKLKLCTSPPRQAEVNKVYFGGWNVNNIPVTHDSILSKIFFGRVPWECTQCDDNRKLITLFSCPWTCNMADTLWTSIATGCWISLSNFVPDSTICLAMGYGRSSRQYFTPIPCLSTCLDFPQVILDEFHKQQGWRRTKMTVFWVGNEECLRKNRVNL